MFHGIFTLLEKFAGYGVFAVFLEECCSSASARGVFRSTGIKSRGWKWLASASYSRLRRSVITPREPPTAGDRAIVRANGHETTTGFRLIFPRYRPQDRVTWDIPHLGNA